MWFVREVKCNELLIDTRNMHKSGNIILSERSYKKKEYILCSPVCINIKLKEIQSKLYGWKTVS